MYLPKDAGNFLYKQNVDQPKGDLSHMKQKFRKQVFIDEKKQILKG